MDMTGFENKSFRELIRIKARELELTETEKGEDLAHELKELVNRIYAFQQKMNADNE